MKWFRTGAARWVIGVGVMLAVVGCGGTGTVSGKVTLNGKPLPGGVVYVHDSEGQSRSGGITKEGTYAVSNIAPGTAKINVLTLSSMPSVRDPQGGGKNPLGEYVPIPAKYMDFTTSGLGLEVKSGKQDYDIKMEGEAAPPPAEQK
jgi:hypothetical protein